MDLKFSNEAFSESEQFKGLSRFDNVYIIPREVSYDSYIND